MEKDLDLHPVVGLVLQAGDADKFLRALGFESLDPCFQGLQAGFMSYSMEEDGGDRRLVQLASEADGGVSPDPV